MYLADFPVEYGILRVDKMKLHRRPVEITLGAYGFPDNGTEITVMELKAENQEKLKAKAVVLKGTDAEGRPRQLAMTIYDGWDDIGIIHSHGSNPDSDKSIVLYAKTQKTKQYGGYEQ